MNKLGTQCDALSGRLARRRMRPVGPPIEDVLAMRRNLWDDNCDLPATCWYTRAPIKSAQDVQEQASRRTLP